MSRSYIEEDENPVVRSIEMAEWFGTEIIDSQIK